MCAQSITICLNSLINNNVIVVWPEENYYEQYGIIIVYSQPPVHDNNPVCPMFSIPYAELLGLYT